MATPGVLKQLASALAVSAARQRPGHLREKSFMLRCRFTSVAIILAAPFVLGIGVAFSQVANSQTAKPELTWAPCGDIPDTECAGLPVPIDYARPGDGTMTLRLPRAPSPAAGRGQARERAPAAARRPGGRHQGDHGRRDARGAACCRLPASV